MRNEVGKLAFGDIRHRGVIEVATALDRRAANDDDGPDIIYDSVGGALTADCLEVLAPLGQLVI